MRKQYTSQAVPQHLNCSQWSNWLKSAHCCNHPRHSQLITLLNKHALLLAHTATHRKPAHVKLVWREVKRSALQSVSAGVSSSHEDCCLPFVKAHACHLCKLQAGAPVHHPGVSSTLKKDVGLGEICSTHSMQVTQL